MDEEAFLRAILDHPRDLSPRLVYCDWLEEGGRRPAFAKFLRYMQETEHRLLFVGQVYNDLVHTNTRIDDHSGNIGLPVTVASPPRPIPAEDSFLYWTYHTSPRDENMGWIPCDVIEWARQSILNELPLSRGWSGIGVELRCGYIERVQKVPLALLYRVLQVLKDAPINQVHLTQGPAWQTFYEPELSQYVMLLRHETIRGRAWASVVISRTAVLAARGGEDTLQKWSAGLISRRTNEMLRALYGRDIDFTFDQKYQGVTAAALERAPIISRQNPIYQEIVAARRRPGFRENDIMVDRIGVTDD